MLYKACGLSVFGVKASLRDYRKGFLSKGHKSPETLNPEP